MLHYQLLLYDIIYYKQALKSLYGATNGQKSNYKKKIKICDL